MVRIRIYVLSILLLGAIEAPKLEPEIKPDLRQLSNNIRTINPDIIENDLWRDPLDSLKIVSPFGMRFHPIDSVIKTHKGIDYAGDTTDVVYSAGTGLARVDTSDSYGILVTIYHSDSLITKYAHLSKVLIQDSIIVHGDSIGYIGTTGNSTGPHLHYEIIKNGEYKNPLKNEN